MSDLSPKPDMNCAVDQPNPSNALGLTGFIVSLIGLVITCGVLCPIGLLISLVGLLWRPRGFAVAGTVIGLVGSVLLATLTAGFAMTFFAVKEVAESAAHQTATQAALAKAAEKIETYRAESGTLPDGIEGNKLILDIEDPWNNGLQYEVEGEAFHIRSAGKDNKFNTGDDLMYPPAEISIEPGRIQFMDGGITISSEEGIAVEGAGVQINEEGITIKPGNVRISDDGIQIGGERDGSED